MKIASIRFSLPASDCTEYIGSLIAWPDFLGGLQGRVEQRSSILCHGMSHIIEYLNLSGNYFISHGGY